MAKKNVFICVHKDTTYLMKWAMRDFEHRLNIMYFDSPDRIETELASGTDCSLIIFESVVNDVPTLDFAKKIKTNKPSINIVFILSAETTKEALVDAIQTKTASGVLVKPFTSKQVSDYIYKFCDFQKPQDTPWYKK